MFDSDREAFLRVILENPEEDTPRLIFADWLQEQGDETRAEFIRLQCELARGVENEELNRELEARSQAFLLAHQVEWQNELPGWDGVKWETFERGFVSSVRVDSPDAFFAHAEEIFQVAPIQTLSLHRFYSDQARALAEMKELTHLQNLHLEDGNRIGNPGVESLAKSPYLSQLRILKLRANSIGPAGARAIAQSVNLSNLLNLDLDRNDLFDEGPFLLAESKTLTSMKYLSLGWTQMGDPGLASIAKSEALKGLVWLYLSSNQIHDEGVAALAASHTLRRLKALYLDSNRIGDVGAIALANSPVCKRLQWLYLRQNRISDPGGIALASSPYLEQVHELILGDNQIGTAADLLRSRFGRRVWVQ